MPHVYHGGVSEDAAITSANHTTVASTSTWASANELKHEPPHSEPSTILPGEIWWLPGQV